METKLLPDVLRLPAICLAAHSYEHQRPSGIMSDQTAHNWYARLNREYQGMPLPDHELVNGIIVRSLIIDYALLDFLANHNRVLVVDLGCGFSTRKQRLRIAGQWVHADFPDVLQARQSLGSGGSAELSIGMDLTKTDGRWPLDGLLETTVVNYLFILEGVLNHLPRSAALGLLALLRERYRGESVIGTVITKTGLLGAGELAHSMGLDVANMWAVGNDELGQILAPSRLERIWLLGKAAHRLGLVRSANGDEASGFVFRATL